MVLFKETKEGRVQMTKEEETSIKAEWAANESLEEPPTLEERIGNIEKRINALETGKV